MVQKIETRKEKEEIRHDGGCLCAPLCFDEQVMRELSQIVVLEVKDLQLRPLQPLSQPTHLVPACQQLPQAPAGQQPTTQTTQKAQCVSVCTVNLSVGAALFYPDEYTEQYTKHHLL